MADRGRNRSIPDYVVVKIYKELKKGIDVKEISKNYGISLATIYKIKNKEDRFSLTIRILEAIENSFVNKN